MTVQHDRPGLKKRWKQVQEHLVEFSSLRQKLKPNMAALSIITIYSVLGCLWILLSDEVLYMFTEDPDVISSIQLYKGWAYVLITAVVFFLIIRKRILMYQFAVNRIFDGYKQLSKSYEDLMRMENQLYLYAYQDLLTGLPNREQLQEYAESRIRLAKENGGRVAYAYIDIDHFKHFNDTMGHDAGDELLRFLAGQLFCCVRASDMVGRISGDEFGIVLAGVNDRQQAEEEIRRIMQRIKTPWNYLEKSYYVSVSVGVAIYPDHGSTVRELLQSADTALFHAKESGRDSYSFFTTEMREKTAQYIHMNNQLVSSLQNGEFVLYYQPEVLLEGDGVPYVEALIRWNHPETGFVSPKDFIPFAEKTGLIRQVDQWVLDRACAQLESWQGLFGDDFRISVNCSGSNLTESGFPELVRHILTNHRIDGSRIILEVTETALLRDLDQAVVTLLCLKEMGITIALDDFGTGYSSLTYLQVLPIDIIKVDQSFIANIRADSDSLFILRLIIDLAHNLGMIVVAEGVETGEQRDLLAASGCDVAQGYFYAKPAAPAVTEEYIIHMQKGTADGKRDISEEFP